MTSMPFHTYAHAEFLTQTSEARGGFPQGEPIPVQIEKRGSTYCNRDVGKSKTKTIP